MASPNHGAKVLFCFFQEAKQWSISNVFQMYAVAGDKHSFIPFHSWQRKPKGVTVLSSYNKNIPQVMDVSKASVNKGRF